MSAALDAVLSARVYEGGRAVRRTTMRHTRLDDEPLGIVMWRLGGERFRAAAVAWGPVGGPFQIAVAGEPRNRDLYFAGLTPFARDLCARVQGAADLREHRQRGQYVDEIPVHPLQIVVPNRTTVSALGLLGRYLGYVSDRSGVAPDPALVEAGRHLRLYARHARVPGQALIVPLDRLLAEHWATLLSPFEQANLAAFDAQIEPHDGVHAFDASATAEAALHIGPEPTEDIDRVTDGLLRRFNEARAGSTDLAVVEPLLDGLRAHYTALVTPVWDLMQRVVERERALPEAPSVTDRFGPDREAFGRHVDWVTGGGRYRTTDTPRQAAMTLRRLEDAQTHYEAGKAIDDPACMVPYLLDGHAIRGEVTSVDHDNRVVVRVRAVPRPRVVVRTDDPVTLPVGKKLWWTDTAHDEPWEVLSTASAGSGSRVVLQLCAAPTPWRVPPVGARVTLSTLHTRPDAFSLVPPRDPPWTHQPATPPAPPEPIDLGDADSETSAVDSSTVADPEVYR